MLLPIFWQITINRYLKEFPLVREFTLVFLDLSSPISFLPGAALNCLAEMSQRFIGYEKLFVFGPAKMSFGRNLLTFESNWVN